MNGNILDDAVASKQISDVISLYFAENLTGDVERTQGCGSGRIYIPGVQTEKGVRRGTENHLY